jgi:hypothetical protein
MDGADSDYVVNKIVKKIKNMLNSRVRNAPNGVAPFLGKILKVTLLWVSHLQNLAKRWRYIVGSVSYA